MTLERCPACGYTKEDAMYLGDHHLCSNHGHAPWEQSAPEHTKPQMSMIERSRLRPRVLKIVLTRKLMSSLHDKAIEAEQAKGCAILDWKKTAFSKLASPVVVLTLLEYIKSLEKELGLEDQL